MGSSGIGPLGIELSSKSRGKRSTTIVLSIAMLLFGAATIVAAVLLAHTQNEVRAFDSAPACTGAAGPTCVLAEAATVSGVGSTSSGKSSYNWVDLSWPGSGGTVRTDMGDRSGGVWPLLKSGDTALVYVWHGRVMIVDYQADSSFTDYYPGHEIPATVGTASLCGGLFLAFLFFLCATRIRRFKKLGTILGLWALVSGCVCVAICGISGSVDSTLLLLGAVASLGLAIGADLGLNRMDRLDQAKRPARARAKARARGV